MVCAPSMRNPHFERKYRRFDLSFAVQLTFYSGGIRSDIEAMSRNVSICGLLLETRSTVPQGSEVSFTMTIPTRSASSPIELVGKGNVIRVEEVPGTAIRIAVECMNPITQLENYFPQ